MRALVITVLFALGCHSSVQSTATSSGDEDTDATIESTERTEATGLAETTDTEITETEITETAGEQTPVEQGGSFNAIDPTSLCASRVGESAHIDQCEYTDSLVLPDGGRVDLLELGYTAYQNVQQTLLVIQTPEYPEPVVVLAIEADSGHGQDEEYTHGELGLDDGSITLSVSVVTRWYSEESSETEEEREEYTLYCTIVAGAGRC